MRGFGVVQACFAHESQMEKLAAAVGISPVDIRLLNAMETGDRMITGQIMDSVAPVAQCIRETDAIPMPPPMSSTADLRTIPGGTGLTAQPSNIKRGVGWGVSIKNLMYSEGFDDYSTARCRISDGVVSIKFATSEVGQGFTMLAQQIARTVLGVDDVFLDTIDTQVGSAGSTSASRQTWMSGGAVQAACRAALEKLFDYVAMKNSMNRSELEIDGTDIFDRLTGQRIAVTAAIQGVDIDCTEEYHHPATEDMDENGQGNCHVAYAFVAHRAVVDVDPELGLVKVVQIATAQDVGRVLNPLSAMGQVEGGIAQGLGLAVMEEIIVKNGKVSNPSFTDYLLPTFLDSPTVEMVFIEEHEPKSPLGAKGIGEPPCISVTPAIANAIRQAIGKELPRVPIRPYDICL
jgi:CO/xanthine dehydrogenase Mo-binding subunit